MNGYTFISRIALTDDQTFVEAAEYVTSSYSPETLVLTEEPIGVLIAQPYMSLDLWALGVNRLRPDVVVGLHIIDAEPLRKPQN